MKKHVLVITNIKSDDLLPLEKARDIIHPFDASVEVIKFLHSKDQLDTSIEQLKDSLSSTVNKVFDDTSEITSEVIYSDNIADWVVTRCQQTAVDLVIKTGHRSESLFHTPCDWQLIRHLPCPILIASHVKWKSKANILLTVDLSENKIMHQELNSLTLNWGKVWSRVTHTELHAMYSIPVANSLLELGIVDKYTVKQDDACAAQQKMNSLLDQFDLKSVTSHIIAGPPVRTIPHLANELHSDLVVMGTVGREGVSGFLLGNTAEKVMHNLRTDCLIIGVPQVST